MKLAGDVAADGQVPALLASGHVGDVVKEVHHHHISRGDHLQSFFDLLTHFLNSGFVRPPAASRTDHNLVASIGKSTALFLGMAASDEQIAAMHVSVHQKPVVHNVRAQAQVEKIV